MEWSSRLQADWPFFCASASGPHTASPTRRVNDDMKFVISQTRWMNVMIDSWVLLPVIWALRRKEGEKSIPRLDGQDHCCVVGQSDLVSLCFSVWSRVSRKYLCFHAKFATSLPKYWHSLTKIYAYNKRCTGKHTNKGQMVVTKSRRLEKLSKNIHMNTCCCQLWLILENQQDSKC